ncbi:MAG: CYTH domain-containing protein [Synechococcales cyanobacterium RU_4_20]|nr:CYTH domain-containing protein [Synechococcales cyanobacterium RU_4_20]NJR70167.1 CYTH domain-containing protein [Synechococcales cyanobacterium CRU_2_2]
MGVEIERKYLLRNQSWRGLAAGVAYCQGYIPTPDHRTVRVRTAGETGYLTLKGPVQGMSRSEFEYEIPVAEAEQILATLCDRPLIEKIRYKIPCAGHVWELDEFLGENLGLILIEVELGSEAETLVLPDWVGLEVTGDRRYYNSYLAKHPFRQWPDSVT